MKQRFIIQLIWTAIAAPLLMLGAFELDGTGMSWLGGPFSAPGLAVAGVLLHGEFHGGQAERYLTLAFSLNFVFIWILLLALLKVLGRFIAQRKLKAN